MNKKQNQTNLSLCVDNQMSDLNGETTSVSMRAVEVSYKLMQKTSLKA